MITLRITRREAELLDLGKFPNAGPHPDVIGMKMKWGGRIGWQGVCCVSDGEYLYHVDLKTYNKIKETLI